MADGYFFRATEKRSPKATLYKWAISLLLFGLTFLIDQWIVSYLGHGKG